MSGELGSGQLGRVRMSILAIVVVLVSACGGGGGGSTPSEPTTGTFFTSAGGGGPNAISLAQVSSTSSTTTLVLRVEARQVPDLYGVAFDLTFPGDLLSFEGASEGAVLGSGGVETSLQVAESGGARIVVGLSRLGDVPGVDADGGLLDLTFRVSGAGTGTVTFARQSAFDADGESIAGVSWSGGSLRVVR